MKQKPVLKLHLKTSILTLTLALLLLPLSPSKASSSALTGPIHPTYHEKNYLRYQAKSSFSLYKPVNTLSLLPYELKSLPCGGGGENWVYTAYKKDKKIIELMQTKPGSHCSNPGISFKIPTPISVNDIPATLNLYCDPISNPSACKSSSFKKYGGYLLFTLPGYYKYQGVNIQLQSSKGITLKELISVASSLTPASVRASK